MLGAIGHRGQDGVHVRRERHVALGLNFLINTPEAHLEGIVADAGRASMIVADVRLDNREDLAVAVQFQRSPLAEVSDSELILAAYEKWGEECPARLLGDFAFAIYDRTRDLSFCARDHFGVKPFLYHLSPNLFAFGTEVKALLAAPFVPRTVNETRIADFLVRYLENYDDTSTFYNEIGKLSPAHSLTVSRSSDVRRRYWGIDQAPELPRRSDNEYCEQFREMFGQAVKTRLRSAQPVGVMLSGGVDSSSIACMAQRVLGEEAPVRLRTYSGIADPGYRCPETPFLDALEGTFTAPARRFRCDEMDHFSDNVWHMLRTSDDPFDAGMADFRFAINAMAGADGVTAVLNGVDGDLVASQTDWAGAAFVEKGRLEALALACSMWRSQGGWTALGIRHTQKKAFRTLRRFFVPELLRRSVRTLRPFRNSPPWRGTLCSRELAERVDLSGRVEQFRLRVGPSGSTARQLFESQFTRPYLAVANDRYDRAAALCGVESRSPLQDRRLVEFLAALPWEQRVRNGWTKYILRASLDSIVPDPIRWQHGYWLRASEDAVRETLRQGRDRLANYIDLSALDGHTHRWYTRHDRQVRSSVVAALALAEWLRRNGS